MCVILRVRECLTCLLMQYSSDCRHFLASFPPFGIPLACLQLLQLSPEGGVRGEDRLSWPLSVHLPEHVHLPCRHPSLSSCLLQGSKFCFLRPFYTRRAISVALSRFALKCIIFACCLLRQQQVFLAAPAAPTAPSACILVLKLRNQLVMTMHNS